MKNNAVCDCNAIYQEVVDKTLALLPKNEDILEVAKFFNVLGDSTRMKIVFCLLQNEMCVCDICNVLNMTKSATSHQLSFLRDFRLVKSRREGKTVFYSLDDEHVSDVVKTVLIHIKHK
ncbi:MAG: metalloregulator ArsR/SmtB family transcription factor [Clostridia bacterium]